jgi:hypothetical protein
VHEQTHRSVQILRQASAPGEHEPQALTAVRLTLLAGQVVVVRSALRVTPNPEPELIHGGQLTASLKGLLPTGATQQL